MGAPEAPATVQPQPTVAQPAPSETRAPAEGREIGNEQLAQNGAATTSKPASPAAPLTPTTPVTPRTPAQAPTPDPVKTASLVELLTKALSAPRAAQPAVVPGSTNPSSEKEVRDRAIAYFQGHCSENELKSLGITGGKIPDINSASVQRALQGMQSAARSRLMDGLDAATAKVFEDRLKANEPLSANPIGLNTALNFVSHHESAIRIAELELAMARQLVTSTQTGGSEDIATALSAISQLRSKYSDETRKKVAEYHSFENWANPGRWYDQSRCAENRARLAQDKYVAELLALERLEKALQDQAKSGAPLSGGLANIDKDLSQTILKNEQQLQYLKTRVASVLTAMAAAQAKEQARQEQRRAARAKSAPAIGSEGPAAAPAGPADPPTPAAKVDPEAPPKPKAAPGTPPSPPAPERPEIKIPEGMIAYHGLTFRQRKYRWGSAAHGAMIATIEPESVFAAQDIRVGDQLFSIDGKVIGTAEQARQAMDEIFNACRGKADHQRRVIVFKRGRAKLNPVEY